MYGNTIVFFVGIVTVSAGIANLYKGTEMPPSCVGKSYCFEKSKKYPQKLIDNIIAELDPPVVEGEGGMSIANRDSNENPEHGCERKIDFEPIYEIVDKEDNLRFVVQSEKFLQKIRTESCVKPGRMTGPGSLYFDEHLLSAWNVTCKEKRIDYSFLALSLDGNHLEDVEVQGGVPICCSCHLKSL